MPNYVVTRITGPLNVLEEAFINDAGKADFNILIPEPPNVEKGGCSGDHAEGEICWYRWRVDNWGAKWNAANSFLEPDDTRDGWGTLEFRTAWAHPWAIMNALIDKYPRVPFEVVYADEDLGFNVGKYTVDIDTEGDQEAISLEDTDEGRDLAAQLHWGKPYAELMEEWDEE